jgi:hypothetical protein
MKRACRTRYRGTLFRSWLESLWARAFDRCRLDWRYEPKRFRLGSFTYLPDFWLAAPDAYVEVKPVLPSLVECFRCKLLCQQARRPVFILAGPPDRADCFVYSPTDLFPGVHYRPVPLRDVLGSVEAP